jgi:putative glutamine amidotransferase
MARPVIGITGPNRGGISAWFCAAWAIRLAGGRPVRITPSRGGPSRSLDGLVIGGGADVAPERYGFVPEPREAPHLKEELGGRTFRSQLRSIAGYLLSPLIYVARRIFSTKRPEADAERDILEVKLLSEAERAGAPVLGICRGAQLMNVHRGGTLHQGLESFYVESPNPWTVFPRKTVNVEPGTRLAALLGRTRCRVNSLHRQAVDQIGADLAVAACEPNGVVQAVELPGHRFYLGVQWHPEYLPQRPEQRQLFRELVRAAAECAIARGQRPARSPLGLARDR